MKNTRKYTIFALAIALLLVLGWLVLMFLRNDSSSERSLTVAEETQTQTQDPSVTPSEEQGLPTKDDEQNNDTHEDTQEDPNNQAPEGARASIVESKQDGAGNLYLEVELTGVTAGTCSLTLAKDSDKITQTSGVYYSPNSSYVTCDGFRIPSEELETGSWEATVEVKSPQAEVSPAKETIPVEV